MTGMTPSDLAELITEFNAVTSRLQEAHESLTGEVQRLKGELSEKNRQLERSRRLAALGEMAAGIAHEVRNPLGSIRLYAKMLEEDLVDRPTERSAATKIGTAVRGLDGVVSDVLHFAREMRLDIVECSAGELFDDALSECAEIVGPMGGSGGVGGVGVEVSGGSVMVPCDQAHIRRALVNLIRNAAEAMRSASDVPGVIRLVAETFEDEDGRSWVALRVRDSGPGVPEEVRERMFNPFFTTRATGTGLGLAIVHRITDAHGGWADVRSITEGGETLGAEGSLVLPRNAGGVGSPGGPGGDPDHANTNGERHP